MLRRETTNLVYFPLKMTFFFWCFFSLKIWWKQKNKVDYLMNYQNNTNQLSNIFQLWSFFLNLLEHTQKAIHEIFIGMLCSWHITQRITFEANFFQVSTSSIFFCCIKISIDFVYYSVFLEYVVNYQSDASINKLCDSIIISHFLN